jgi:hypothetical protein
MPARMQSESAAPYMMQDGARESPWSGPKLLHVHEHATEMDSETVMSTALTMPVAISAVKLSLLKPPLK